MVGVAGAVPATVGVAVGVRVAVGVAVTVVEGVPVGVALGQVWPLERCITSGRNVKVCPMIPPTLQIFPDPKNPAWFACRLADPALEFGRLGGEVTHAPAGQVPTGSSSTSLVESKKPPP